MRESRIKEAYEAGVDTLEEYKNNKDRLVSDRLELTAALSQLLQEDEEEEKPGMRQVLAARKKPSDTKTVEGERSSFSSRGTRLPEAASSRLFDGSDPADAVEQLVSALKADGVL